VRPLPVVERPARPRELTTAEAKQVLDELHDLQVFYINIGGGEPMVRRDFFELLEYSIGRGIGVKFSTNGAFIDAEKARRLASMDYLDIQISLDGIDAARTTACAASAATTWRGERWRTSPPRTSGPFKISVVVTRHNVDQLDGFKALADSYGAQLRVTRLRPSGRWRRLVARPPPDERAASDRSTSGSSRTGVRAHGRLVLPPQRARRVACRG
jgi:MoaA/NifB/PqqE/SkfB family radical SAM enzyme